MVNIMTAIEQTTLTHLPIAKLYGAEDNIRTEVGDLDELAASIHALGIIEPLIVAVHPDKVGAYEVIAGNRRLAAAVVAELDTVPCIIRDFDDAARTEVMLVENLQRAGLNPIEEATGYGRLVECGLSQAEIAERVGCNQSHVSKRLLLLTLPAAAHDKIIAGDLIVNDALLLAKLNKLDEASATEWLTTPGWPGISERIRRIEDDTRKAASIAEGEASGLVDVRAWGWGQTTNLIDVDRDVATMWNVDHAGKIKWLGHKPAVEPGAKPKSTAPEKPVEKPKWEIKREKDAERTERCKETMAAAHVTQSRDWLIGRSSDLLVRHLDGAKYGSVDLCKVDMAEDVDMDDAPLVAAIAILTNLGELSLQNVGDEEWFGDPERWTLRTLEELGYELDDEEQAALRETPDAA
jgi:ParB/RepB/Spo0J family partition protein